jgi:ATP-dependent DNA helicase RecQ
VKGLLRSYDGIFDIPCAINEHQLGKFISIPNERLFQILMELNGMGIIDYTPQKEKPQIYFLQNRVKADDLFINEKNIFKRKRAYEKRLETMVHFATNKNQCRSKMIATYFNDLAARGCGICDNCINAKRIIISKDEFDLISKGIKNISHAAPVSTAHLFQNLSSFKENKVWKVLTFLQEENIIVVNRNGLIESK